MGCNHQGQFQSCDTFHECVGCRASFMGSMVDGYCLSCQPVVAAAKRALAEKVIQRVELFMPPITADYDDDDKSLARTLTALVSELQRLFTESGVAVEKEG